MDLKDTPLRENVKIKSIDRKYGGCQEGGVM